MNNNNRGNSNNNNNRRRGRGNRQQGGGGQQLNRIDSRARGNAPQLLEKYRKLAQDAHLNGDRVQAEYYRQFADHYFRVIADARVRQEEQRRPRDERWEGGEEADDSGEFSVESDFPSFEQPPYQRRERDDRPRQRPMQDQEHDRSQDEDSSGDEDTRGNVAEAADSESGEPNPYEPPQNPFVREPRGTRGLKPRREDRRPRREERDAASAGDEPPAALDPASLPPAISASRSESAPEMTDDEAPAKPRRGRPRRKPVADEAGEAAEAVN